MTLPKDVRDVKDFRVGEKILFRIEDTGIRIDKIDEDIIAKTAGLWKGMKETGVEYVRRMRAGWKKRASY